MPKKTISSIRDLDTFLFCEKIKKSSPKLREDLMSKESINELSKGLKVLNLEEDEDISHHVQVAKNKYFDVFRGDEENSYKN